jgi:hypothetical protein
MTRDIRVVCRRMPVSAARDLAKRAAVIVAPVLVAICSIAAGGSPATATPNPGSPATPTHLIAKATDDQAVIDESLDIFLYPSPLTHIQPEQAWRCEFRNRGLPRPR